jgi:hypothetical protein
MGKAGKEEKAGEGSGPDFVRSRFNWAGIGESGNQGIEEAGGLVPALPAFHMKRVGMWKAGKQEKAGGGWP